MIKKGVIKPSSSR
jgi:hypothetical protein